jgi:hypothetical protein
MSRNVKRTACRSTVAGIGRQHSQHDQTASGDRALPDAEAIAGRATLTFTAVSPDDAIEVSADLE